ncbi:hypothetical protein [Pseudomonas phage PH826]|nr:hypothetical protein [Pseudomonas phage PH826]
MAADAPGFIVEIANSLGPGVASELVPTMLREQHQSKSCTAFVLKTCQGGVHDLSSVMPRGTGAGLG